MRREPGSYRSYLLRLWQIENKLDIIIDANVFAVAAIYEGVDDPHHFSASDWRRGRSSRAMTNRSCCTPATSGSRNRSTS